MPDNEVSSRHLHGALAFRRLAAALIGMAVEVGEQVVEGTGAGRPANADEDMEARRARMGPAFLIGSRLAVGTLGFIGNVITARLLIPSDFGLVAMVLVITGLINVFRDFGLTNAVLRKGHIDEAEVSFLFWFNAGATVALAALLAAAGPLIETFYRELRVASVLWMLLPSFVLSGLTLQHAALLRRRFQFPRIAGIEAAGAAVNLLVTAAVALLTRDVLALVAGATAQALVTALLTLLAARWQPGRLRMLHDASELVRFGANSTVFSLLNFLSASLPTLLIGRLLGAASLGQFNRAQLIFLLPVNSLLQPIANAALPVMARLRPDLTAYRRMYLDLVGRLSCALVPGAAALTMAAAPLVQLLFGPGWDEAGLILTLLAPSLAVYGVNWPTTDLLITQDRSQALRRQGGYDVVLRLAGLGCGLPFGLVGAAAGYSAATLLTAPLRIALAGAIGPVTAADQWRAIVPALPLGIGSGLGALEGRLAAELAEAGSAITLAATGLGAATGMSFAMILSMRARRGALSVLATLIGRHSVL